MELMERNKKLKQIINHAPLASWKTIDGQFFYFFFLLMSVCTVFEHHQAIGVITVIIIHTGVFRVRAGIPRRTECIEEEVSVLRTIVASVWMLSGPVRILLFL